MKNQAKRNLNLTELNLSRNELTEFPKEIKNLKNLITLYFDNNKLTEFPKEIINLTRPISKKNPPMSLYARSAQFAPFAALTGYEDAIKEVDDERNVSKK